MEITFIQNLNSSQIEGLTPEQISSIADCCFCGSECDYKTVRECKNVLIGKALEEEKEVRK